MLVRGHAKSSRRKKIIYSEPSQGRDYFRIDYLNLFLQPGFVRGDFFRQRVAVFGRAALHYICNVNRFARPFDI